MREWVQSQRPQKDQTRNYDRCRRCGRSRAYLRKFGLCRMCPREVQREGYISG